ncbi:hypothetical protein HDU86_005284 [Geranomyces michiganensis]|nr:hypothetical protein HDU86_005284 [Geranomyces michiganensis]
MQRRATWNSDTYGVNYNKVTNMATTPLTLYASSKVYFGCSNCYAWFYFGFTLSLDLASKINIKVETLWGYGPGTTLGTAAVYLSPYVEATFAPVEKTDLVARQKCAAMSYQISYGVDWETQTPGSGISEPKAILAKSKCALSWCSGYIGTYGTAPELSSLPQALIRSLQVRSITLQTSSWNPTFNFYKTMAFHVTCTGYALHLDAVVTTDFIGPMTCKLYRDGNLGGTTELVTGIVVDPLARPTGGLTTSGSSYASVTFAAPIWSASSKGCDGIPGSGKVLDSCSVCGGSNDCHATCPAEYSLPTTITPKAADGVIKFASTVFSTYKAQPVSGTAVAASNSFQLLTSGAYSLLQLPGSTLCVAADPGGSGNAGTALVSAPCASAMVSARLRRRQTRTASYSQLFTMNGGTTKNVLTGLCPASDSSGSLLLDDCTSSAATSMSTKLATGGGGTNGSGGSDDGGGGGGVPGAAIGGAIGGAAVLAGVIGGGVVYQKKTAARRALAHAVHPEDPGPAVMVNITSGPVPIIEHDMTAMPASPPLATTAYGAPYMGMTQPTAVHVFPVEPYESSRVYADVHPVQPETANAN